MRTKWLNSCSDVTGAIWIPIACWLLEAAPEAIAWEVPDETMHLSYALQWFAIALVIDGGSLALALRRLRPAA